MREFFHGKLSPSNPIASLQLATETSRLPPDATRATNCLQIEERCAMEDSRVGPPCWFPRLWRKVGTAR
mgnify:FL=1